LLFLSDDTKPEAVNLMSVVEKMSFFRTKLDIFNFYSDTPMVWLMDFETLVSKYTKEGQQPMYFTHIPYMMSNEDQTWLFSVFHLYSDASWPDFKNEFIKHFRRLRREIISEALMGKYVKGDLYDFATTKINSLKKLYPDHKDSFFIDAVVASLPANLKDDVEEVQNLSVDMFLKLVNVLWLTKVNRLTV
jgi:hypothetical protein